MAAWIGAGKLILAAFCSLEGVASGGLRFKVIAPNVDTEATLVALLFYFISVQKQREMPAKGVLEKKSKGTAKADSGIFTSVTGDTKLLLIKN